MCVQFHGRGDYCHSRACADPSPSATLPCSQTRPKTHAFEGQKREQERSQEHEHSIGTGKFTPVRPRTARPYTVSIHACNTQLSTEHACNGGMGVMLSKLGSHACRCCHDPIPHSTCAGGHGHKYVDEVMSDDMTP